MELDYKSIGKNIKIARMKKDMTQEKVSFLTDTSISHISNIENGYTKVSLPTLVCICNALEISVDEVLNENVISYRSLFACEILKLCEDCNDNEKRMIKEMIELIKKYF